MALAADPCNIHAVLRARLSIHLLDTSIKMSAHTSELSAVDDSSTFERLLHVYVNEPCLKLIPRWVKPNTISAVNHFCVWMTVFLAFWASAIDLSEEEYFHGMRSGRDADKVRFQALVLRLIMAFLVFASMVLDCLDGMHARATGQTSRLGEVMDHALDAANIPLLSVGAVFTMGMHVWWRALTMIVGGLVFNAQLAVYRHSGKFIKPPANGPESQMALITVEVVMAVLFWTVGRFHPTIVTVMMVVPVLANFLQFRNAFFFWSHLNWDAAVDHLRFAFTTISFAVLVVFGVISDFIFETASVLIAFRLSGAYVLFIVANKHRKNDATRNGTGKASSVLFSSWSSLYDGFDWTLLTYIALVGAIQYALIDPSFAAYRLQHPQSVQTVVLSELIPTIVFALAVTLVTAADLRKCLPYLVAPPQLQQPLVRLFI